jgi:anaerobic selenocysteine-containing dehydrogenase
MAKSDLVVIWGTNAVSTQVNVMTHAIRARKERSAKIAAVDIYMNGTMEQADLPVLVKPGTDGALACAVMHCLFRDRHADWDYLDKYTDAPLELETHLRTRDPKWASEITGAPVETIEEFAKLIGERKRAFFRLGYGFSRSRNGAANMHAASCIPAVTGAWQLEGGGAFHINADIFKLDKTLIEGLDVWDRSVRMLDQSRIGAILTGESDALQGGGPVKALIIQNTNPMSVCPDQSKVKRGFAREDLFVCVHEQFMTETAQMADVVLPATTFLEHDDIYRGGGHQYLLLGPKLVEPPGECRNNHDVIAALAKRVGAEHRGFTMSPRELIDQMLQISKRGTLQQIEANRWIVSRRSANRIFSTDSTGRTAGSDSSPIGATCRSAAPIRADRSPTCRGCRITGPRSSRPTARIRFAWPRHRRAVSSIRRSTRREPRWRRRSGRR